jgi:hypothetical protein
MFAQFAPVVIAFVGLLMYLIPKPRALPLVDDGTSLPMRISALGLVIFGIGLVFAVATITGQAILR